MKIASFSIDNYHIEMYNNMWTGVETVYVNGRRVSRQFNWFHGIHRFSLPASDGVAIDHYRVDFRFSWTSMTMITTDLARNGVPLMKNSEPLYTPLNPPAIQHPGFHDRLELRQLDARPLYREEDLV